MATRQDRAVTDTARRFANERSLRFRRIDRRHGRPSLTLMMKADIRRDTLPLVDRFLVNGGKITRIANP